MLKKKLETPCADCGNPVPEDAWWLDDGAILCRECAGRRRIEYARRNERLYQAQQGRMSE